MLPSLVRQSERVHFGKAGIRIAMRHDVRGDEPCDDRLEPPPVSPAEAGVGAHPTITAFVACPCVSAACGLSLLVVHSVVVSFVASCFVLI